MQYSLLFPDLPEHTPGHINCPACAVVRNRAQMQFSPSMLFEEAAKAFYSLRCLDLNQSQQFAAPSPHRRPGYVRDHTLRGYLNYTRSLELFFHGMRLDEIRWWHMRAYQDARVAGAPPFVRLRRPQDAKPVKRPNGAVLPPKGPTPCPTKPQQANQEMFFLRKLKILTGCWTPEDQQFFKPLQRLESDEDRALSPEQQIMWLDAARQISELVWLYSIVAFDTLASPNELRLLRFGNLKLHYQMITVPWPAAKNPSRHRDVVIESAETLWALEKLIERARSLDPDKQGVYNPLHCLFPLALARGKYDIMRPMSSSGLKKPWQLVRDATGLKKFRIEDTRHTGATRLAEAGVAADVIAARMGHCGPQMRLHYTHISQSAARMQLSRAGALRKPPASVRHDQPKFAWPFPKPGWSN